MNRDKQIEMDCKKCLHFEACQIAFRNSKALSIYEDDYTEEEYFANTIDCDYYIDKTIYRKASEVAEEIFEEIENNLKELKDDYRLLDDMREACAVRYAMTRVAELKEKYIGKDTNVTTNTEET